MPRPSRRYTELAQATSSITPNLSAASVSPAGLESLQLYPKSDPSHSAHSVASPLQNPRVRNSFHGTSASGVSGTNKRPRFYPTGQYPLQQQNSSYRASSAPSSTVLGLSPRPPVPIFSSHSTGDIPQEQAFIDTVMADSPGKSPPSPSIHHTTHETNSCSDVSFDDANLFDDFTANGPGVDATGMYVGTSHVSINDDHAATVSPKDLFSPVDVSAPPSSAFSNLSTPISYENSPFALFASAETSPLYAFDESFDDEQNMYPPLFPVDSASSIDLHTTVESAETTVEIAASQKMSRTASSPGQKSFRSSHPRQSSVSGVNVRKRDKPLPPVTVADPNDIKSVKRSRNTMAARKSRAKKQNKMEFLENRVGVLEAELERYKDVYGPLPH